MSQPDLPPPGNSDAPAEPAFDKEAARARYRALMRSPLMRMLFALTGLVIVCTWVMAFGAAYGPDIQKLPDHDLSVAPAACKHCHEQQIDSAPPFNHSFAPTCGFCHVQGPPPPITATGRLR